MANHHHHHAHLHHARQDFVEEVYHVLQPVAVIEEAAPSPVQHIEARAVELLPRATERCPEGDTSPQCEKPQGSNTLPIALASSIPIVIAIIVFIFLHRRHKKKLRMEDATDRHKSLDFGMDNVNGGPGKGAKNGRKGGPMMTNDPEKSMHGRGRGMSMDMDMGSPYILPAKLHGSRESFHSMSRSIKDNHDPYGQAGYSSDDRYGGRAFKDSASIFTESSRDTSRTNVNLIRGASPMARTGPFPARGDSMTIGGTPTETRQPEVKFPETIHKQDSAMSGFNFSNSSSLTLAELDAQPDTQTKNVNAVNANSMVSQELPASPPVNPFKPELPVKRNSPPAAMGLPSNPRSARGESVEGKNRTISTGSASSDYGEQFKVTPPSPTGPTIVAPKPMRYSVEASIPHAAESRSQAPAGLGVEGLEVGNKRFSMSVRPLPIEDPTENPEERANRIRSFYREYFDESKPDPVGQYGDYYEDYGHEYLEGAIFDPATNSFVVAGAPYAQPITRRAMTPPPRAPPRYGPGPRGPGHFSSGSNPRMPPPRGASSMSARKPMPPPVDLRTLPTPHMLKNDINLFTAMDFAPPVSYRDRQAGRRPDSPMGEKRPYSPAVRAHVPLESSFEELPAVPSPHLLRKSGTFTALDFAPPRKFKDSDAGSDAGSIRSNRSARSQMQLQNIRAGAYRVSRIPKGLAGTRDDLALALRPTMDLVEKA